MASVIVLIDKIPMVKFVRRGRPTRQTVREREDRIHPTPETSLKLRPDPLASFSAEQQAMGLEIARIHAAITGKLNTRAQTLEDGKSLKRKSNEDPLSRISDEKLIRYHEWADKLGRAFIPQHIVIEVIGDMVPCYVLDERLRRPPDTVAGWVLIALDMYGKGRR